ncbi:ParA family protein [Mycolicibacterium llatzerense]|uniref:ParA family protein n=1 Tax=Mycolicibacterium llatzerense TaxID=280871 RepID=UPI0008DD1EC3|nr:ParA family protein [Mycolicibacterium llatzerense]
MTELPDTVLFATQKGGNGKTTTVANLGVAIARTGRKVLVIDADQQGNLTADDLGVPEDQSDQGRNLAIVLQYGLRGGVKLEPYRNIRPNLDILMGGPAIGQVSTAVAAAGETVDLAENFEAALAELCEREQYDIILVDSGHGDKVLLIALMQVCRYLVVPTKEDAGSLNGVRQLAASYRRAKRYGSPISLIGVVLFDVNPNASVRLTHVFNQVKEMLGSEIEPFQATIRSSQALAVDMRERHLTAQELAKPSEEQKAGLLTALRNRNKAGATDRLWAKDPAAVAEDFLKLRGEILRRVKEQAAASVAGIEQ